MSYIVTVKRVTDICMLFAFGVTQPLLSALSRQTVYLHDQRVEWLEVGVLLLLLLLVLPLCFVVLDALIRWASSWIGGYGRNLVLAFLLSLVLLSLLRPCLILSLRYRLIPLGLLVPILVIASSWFLISIYERRPGLQIWFSCLSVGILIFPITFVWQFQQFSAASPVMAKNGSAQTPVPVVLIVFDEFSGTTLLDEHRRIDARCFPQFVRLAGLSTWYPNATTVSPRTDIAVPAILSGRFPTVDRPPLAKDYPGNLFELIEASGSFEMTVFEPVTRLCSETIEREPPSERTQLQRCTDLLKTLGAVYPRLIFPMDTPILFPTVPRAWFGLPATSAKDWGATSEARTGRMLYGGGDFRDKQLDHFLRCLRPSTLPGFRFLHVVLPHYPWTFLPSGEQYESEFAAPERPSGARGELGEMWDDDRISVARNEYRYQLQVGFVDRFIGQLLDRLEATQLLKDCLLIVTADHGVSFRPGHSRRIPDRDTLAEILSVPLFIKLPGQSTGNVDVRNVESVDLLPTILESVGIDIPDLVDGISVAQERRRPRKSVYFQSTMTICEPDLLMRDRSFGQSKTPFRSSELDQLPLEASSHPDWHGLDLGHFTVSDRMIPFEPDSHEDPYQEGRFESSPQLVPHLLSGVVRTSDLPIVPAEVVLTIDGTIVDTGRTSWIDYDRHGFQLFIPSSVTAKAVGKIELYLVDSSKAETRLLRLNSTD